MLLLFSHTVQYIYVKWVLTSRYRVNTCSISFVPLCNDTGGISFILLDFNCTIRSNLWAIVYNLFYTPSSWLATCTPQASLLEIFILLLFSIFWTSASPVIKIMTTNKHAILLFIDGALLIQLHEYYLWIRYYTFPCTYILMPLAG